MAAALIMGVRVFIMRSVVVVTPATPVAASRQNESRTNDNKQQQSLHHDALLSIEVDQ
jgi:hypothetical protein